MPVWCRAPVSAAGSRSRNRIDGTSMLLEPHRCSIDAARRQAIGGADPAKRAMAERAAQLTTSLEAASTLPRLV
jgi:hypothetical protein